MYKRQNFNNTDKSLITSIEASQLDRMTKFGYKTSKTGFDIGTSFEQYNDVYFSPSIESYLETLKTSSSASQSMKKQKGDYFDTSFNYGLTLNKLNHPKEKLYFILGSDAAVNIKTWKNYELLPNLANFLIALRSEDNIDILDKNFPFKYEIILGEKLDLSSSTFRNKLKEKTIKVSDLPSEILTYAKENSIY